MVIQAFEVRGRKEICEFLRVKDWQTAKKRLKRLDLLRYDANKPVLSVEAYNLAVLKRHVD